MRYRKEMAVYLIMLPLVLSSLFTLATQDQQHNNGNHRQLIEELNEAKLKITRLESLLEERILKVEEKNDYIQEREKLIDEMTNEIRDLQSFLSNIQDQELHTEERIAVLEEEVRLLWATSRKNNFDIHNLESRAQDAENRLEEVTSHVEKVADIVEEHWIQIRHLEQALQMTEMRALSIQRELRSTRCTFIKFFNDISAKHLPKLFGLLDTSSCKSSTLGYYVSEVLQQLKKLFSAFKKLHHEFQGLIKQEMRRNEFTAALANEELVVFVASALITFPILAAWMLLFSQ